MKLKTLFSVLALASIVTVSCSDKNQGKTDPEEVQSLEVVTTSLSFTDDGGSQDVTIITNRNWAATSSETWLTLSPNSGSASKEAQGFKATASSNNASSQRSATITVKAGTITKTVAVTQAAGKDDGIEKVTIQQFRAKSSSKTVWYRITATIASIANYTYGNLYLYDETGYVYVYGLTKAKAETNDQTFSELGLKAGDVVTIVANRSDYYGVIEAGGTVPAYYEKHTPGSYDGVKASSTTASWMELPETSDKDGKDVLIHWYHSSAFQGNRSNCVYWDYDNRVATWVAYPLNKTIISSGSRLDTWAFNPLLDPDDQPDINKNSFKAGNGGTYIRGHQLPSADRYGYRENMETFYGSNIMPQDETFNSGIWGSLEDYVRTWCKKSGCDTLYVVTGADCTGSTTYVLDNADKKITVPVACWKAVLRFDKSTGTYNGLATYMSNDTKNGSSFSAAKTISIDALEAKIGIDLFVNLPAAIGAEKAAAVEKENPADQSWWW